MTDGDAPLARRSGVRPPDRTHAVMSSGLRLAVSEWGDPHDPPLLLAHGGGDVARCFDVLAPQLAVGGYRVVSWDQRGHGDSDAAHFYSWQADAHDALAVIDAVGADMLPAVGHSKGGMVVTMLADAHPHRVSHLVSIDGFPTEHPVRGTAGDVNDRLGLLRSWLDGRRRGVRRRSPRKFESLVAQRARISGRLDDDWYAHVVTVTAEGSPDGWRWKADPALDQALSNPLDLAEPLRGMSGLAMPVLAIVGLELEVHAMGTTAEGARRLLPPHGELLAYEDSGHFVHVEHPERVARAILEFLARSEAENAQGVAHFWLRTPSGVSRSARRGL